MSRNLLRTSSMGFSIFFMWEIVVKYHSVFLVSLIPTFSLLGYLIITLPIGYVLDKVNKSKVIFLFSVMTVLVYFLLIFVQSLIYIYAVDFLSFMLYMGSGDAYYSSIKEIVSEDLSGAMSLNTVGRAGSGIAGTALGGSVAYFDPASLPFILVVMALVAASLSFPFKSVSSKDSTIYSFSHVSKVIKLILPLLLMGLLINGAFTAIDVYSSGLFHLILHVNAIYYTAFLMAFSIGELLGGVVGGRIKVLKEGLVSSLISLFGLSFILISITREPLVDVLLSLLVGIGTSLVNIPLDTLLTSLIPNKMMGRTNSIIQIFLLSSSPVMATLYGILATLFGIINVLFAVGVFGILMGIPSFFVIKKFKGMKEEDVQKFIA
ncbi:MFS transporter [Sulfuracidifex metallicus]|nr:MFS transporter [Sulfuracidifex metallicus]WOE51855.1 MFS transporter [Sulfuracidifex metallicus DSM 6482 = JCM 9184]